MVCVMVVEDEADIREMLVEVLIDEGFEIVEAATADAAIELLQPERVRLVLSDINLPGTLDGIALAKAARERSPSIPVIFISGRPAKLEDARVIGDPVAFLQKPFSLTRLVADVQRLAINATSVGPRVRTGGRDVRRIAVVDGETLAFNFVREAMIPLGAQVLCAANGTEGAKLLASSTFDLALIDAVLHDLSGFEVAAVAANANIPALMMSGHPDAAENCESFGFPYVTKPFEIEALRRETGTVLEDRNAAIQRTKEAVAKMQEATKRLKDEIAVTARLVMERREIMGDVDSSSRQVPMPAGKMPPNDDV
jgi:DNA-binding response OmpR family regulator